MTKSAEVFLNIIQFFFSCKPIDDIVMQHIIGREKNIQ